MCCSREEASTSMPRGRRLVIQTREILGPAFANKPSTPNPPITLYDGVHRESVLVSAESHFLDSHDAGVTFSCDLLVVRSHTDASTAAWR